MFPSILFADPRAYQPGPRESSDHGGLSGARTQDDPRGLGVLLLPNDRSNWWLRIAEGRYHSESFRLDDHAKDIKL